MGTSSRPRKQARAELDSTLTGASPELAEAIDRLRDEMRRRHEMWTRTIGDMIVGVFGGVLMFVGFYVLVDTALEWTAFWALR